VALEGADPVDFVETLARPWARCPTLAEAVGRAHDSFDSLGDRLPTRIARRGLSPDQAARLGPSQKATCQPASGYVGPRSPTRAQHGKGKPRRRCCIARGSSVPSPESGRPERWGAEQVKHGTFVGFRVRGAERSSGDRTRSYTFSSRQMVERSTP
jgi:hypothetical protein